MKFFVRGPSFGVYMRRLLPLVLVLATASLSAAEPPRPYHLELEANPAAPFPWLSKFGKIGLHIYRGGVRADSIWLDSFSRNGDANVTVLNPLGRMYVDIPIAEIAPTLTKLAGTGGVERVAKPELGLVTKGKVAGITATRHRLMYSSQAWIDYWTTDQIPENPQLTAIVHELVAGISPGTAEVAKTIKGTPLFVELNFRRYKKLPILYVKKLTWSADDEEEALKLGPIYARATVLEAIWK